MKSDDIGDRFKEYEAVWDLTLPRRMPLVIRVDGRAFHSLRLVKPFDSEFFSIMASVAVVLCQEIQGARLAYFQSDEISVIVRDDMTLQTQPWMGKRLSKLLSLSAAIATAKFINLCGTMKQFDSRAFVLPDVSEVTNYLIWRQQDATRNSVSMAAQAVFSHKELHQKDSAAMIEMLHEAGKPWAATPDHFKRGATVRSHTVTKLVPETGVTCERHEWRVDMHPPIFTQAREYVLASWGDEPAERESLDRGA